MFSNTTALSRLLAEQGGQASGCGIKTVAAFSTSLKRGGGEQEAGISVQDIKEAVRKISGCAGVGGCMHGANTLGRSITVRDRAPIVW